MRRKLLMGNWKMNKTTVETKEFALQSVEFNKLALENNIDIGVAPSYVSLATFKSVNPDMICAAQNCHFENNGAFTGEVSIPMLKDINVNWVILGHSERRTYNNETSADCNLKIKALLANNMTALYCCGESLEIFEDGATKEFVKTQIVEGLEGLTKEEVSKIVIAYEPIWSIGTGKNASKEIAEDICQFIRSVIAELYDVLTSEKVRILYGGSVKPVNVKEYLSMPNIDGALVGGASLAVESFKELLDNIL